VKLVSRLSCKVVAERWWAPNLARAESTLALALPLKALAPHQQRWPAAELGGGENWLALQRRRLWPPAHRPGLEHGQFGFQTPFMQPAQLHRHLGDPIQAGVRKGKSGFPSGSERALPRKVHRKINRPRSRSRSTRRRGPE